MAYSISFNGWALDGTNGIIVDAIDFGRNEDTTPQKSAVADHGTIAEPTQGGLTIAIGGSIIGTSESDLRSKIGALLKNTRGTDRIKQGQLALYTDRHWWAQRIGNVGITPRAGSANASFSMTFFAADPYSRANSISTVVETPALSNPTVSFDFGSDFSGDAWRIPLVITTTYAWARGDLLRIYNSTVGWRFEKIIENAISSGQSLVVDGELFEVTESGSVSGPGISGTFPYLRGGTTNVLTFSGSTRFGSTSFSFYDRYLS